MDDVVVFGGGGSVIPGGLVGFDGRGMAFDFVPTCLTELGCADV